MLGSTWSSDVLGKLAIAGGWLAGSRPMMMLTGELDGQMVGRWWKGAGACVCGLPMMLTGKLSGQMISRGW